MSRKEIWAPFLKQLKTKKIFAGFDGYTDMLYSVVQGERQGKRQIYKYSKDFAKSLLETAGISSEYEIVLKSRRVGGNAPLMSIGMAAMGAFVSCVGVFGEDAKDMIQEEGGLDEGLMNRLKLYSVGDPAVTIALEFEDCKYMFADCRRLQDVTYDRLERIIGRKELRKRVLEADLIAAVNWAALPGLKDILKNLFLPVGDEKDIEKNFAELSQKWLFLDLSDIRKKEAAEIQSYFDIIVEMSRYTGLRTCLSLNENEIRVLADKLGIEEASEGPLLWKIRRCIGVEEVILHAMRKSVYCSGEETEEVSKDICSHPVITTGAGDNFNAGVCIGKLLKLSPRSQIEMGNSAAEYYVTYGRSGSLEEILNWKQQKK